MSSFVSAPIVSALEYFIAWPQSAESRKGRPFTVLAVVIDDDGNDGELLDELLTHLPTLHSTAPDQLCLIVPGGWDNGKGEPETEWSPIASIAADGDHRDGLDAEVRADEAHGDVVGDPVRSVFPSFDERRRRIVRFVSAKDRVHRAARAFWVMQTPELCDWLGIDTRQMPCVALISLPDHRITVIVPRKRITLRALCAGLLHASNDGDLSEPSKAIDNVCALYNIEVSAEIALPDRASWHGWTARTMEPRTSRAAPDLTSPRK